MAQAFVLVNSDIGAEDKVLEATRRISNVKEASIVYGVYDIVLRMTAPSMDELTETVQTNIRTLGNVRSTLTMIVVDNGKDK